MRHSRVHGPRGAVRIKVQRTGCRRVELWCEPLRITHRSVSFQPAYRRGRQPSGRRRGKHKADARNVPKNYCRQLLAHSRVVDGGSTPHPPYIPAKSGRKVHDRGYHGTPLVHPQSGPQFGYPQQSPHVGKAGRASGMPTVDKGA